MFKSNNTIEKLIEVNNSLIYFQKFKLRFQEKRLLEFKGYMNSNYPPMILIWFKISIGQISSQ